RRTLDPARTIERERHQLELDAVLALEAELEDVELQHADGPHDRVLVEQPALPEDLNGALLRELLEPLPELLPPHDLSEARDREELRRKTWEPIELERLTFADRVADPEVPGVEEPDDVARVGRLDAAPLARQELLRVREAH